MTLQLVRFTDTFRPLSGQIIVDRGLRENPLRNDLICPQLPQEERAPKTAVKVAHGPLTRSPAVRLLCFRPCIVIRLCGRIVFVFHVSQLTLSPFAIVSREAYYTPHATL
jgi:hypothetical protein